MGRRKRTLAPGEVPAKLRWRPRLRLLGLISGAIGGLGTVVLVQQYGIAPLTRALSLQGLAGGLLSGVVIPSAIYGVVVRVHNRKLASYLELMTVQRAGASALAAGITFVAMSAGGVLLDAKRADVVLTGSCEAVFNGFDVRGLALEPDAAIEVTIDDSLNAVMSAESDIVAYRFWVEYAGMQLTIDADDDATSGDIDDGGGIAEASVAVADLAWMGAGIYEMAGWGQTATGERCAGSFYFDVDVPPLETAVGAAAAAATAVGAAGAALSVGGAVRDGIRTVSDLEQLLDDLGIPGPDDLGGGPDGGAPADGPGLDGGDGEPPPPPPPDLDHGPTDELPTDDAVPDPTPDDPALDDPALDDPAPDDGVGPADAASVAATAGAVAAAEAVRGTGTPETPPPPTPAAPTDGGWDGSNDDGSDFLGRDTADAVAGGATALNDARERLDGWIDEIDVPDDVKGDLKDDLQLEGIGERLDQVTSTAETFRDTVDRAGEITDDTTARLDRLGVNSRLQDGIIWMRWMTEGVTTYVGDAVDTYLSPVTDRIAEVFGGEASDYSQAAVPVAEAGSEGSNALVRAVENIRGGENYGGQMMDNADLDLDEIFGGNF